MPLQMDSTIQYILGLEGVRKEDLLYVDTEVDSPYNTRRRLIDEGVIVGGMIPKLDACLKCIENGVEFAHIVNGNKDHNLLIELFTDDGVGTMIKRDDADIAAE